MCKDGCVTRPADTTLRGRGRREREIERERERERETDPLGKKCS